MIKIFRCELRRLLFNKFFVALLLITMFFSWRTLTGETILGVANTAPFSPWSFGSYLSSVSPLLHITLLFFLTFLFSPQERRVRVLTSATPVNPARYFLTRCAAIVTGWLLLALAVLLLGCFFYWKLFHFSAFLSLLAPALLALLPSFVLFLGLGAVLGQLHASLLYALMLVSLLLRFTPLSGGGFFLSYPASLGILDPPFSVSADFLITQIICVVSGALLLVFSLRRVLRHA